MLHTQGCLGIKSGVIVLANGNGILRDIDSLYSEGQMSKKLVTITQHCPASGLEP